MNNIAKLFAAAAFAGLVLPLPVARAQESDVHGATPNPFGIGADYHTSQVLEKWMPKMAAIGIHTLRTCTPDQMKYLQGLNVNFGGLLYEIPPGDTLDAPGTLPVKDLASWSAFVTQRVKQANGKVKYWEIWNEPPNGIGKDQTAADYAKLMVSTYDAAHAVDPTCLVGLAAKSVHVNWLEQTINAGAKDHFDYIVLHPYEVLGGVSESKGTEAIYMNIVPLVRKMLAAVDPAKANVPIIFTELGSDASHGADNQAEALIKAFTMGFAQGVASIEWFEGMDGDSGPMGLLQGDLKPRPSYTAMAQMIKHLGQHPTYLGWVLLHEKDYGFVFQGAKGNVLITWAPKGAPEDIDFGGFVTVVDLLTGKESTTSKVTLTVTPVMIEGVPSAIVAQAKADIAKPFPWGGDFTNAKSVSITMGAKNVESGLHTLAGNDIASDVITYGGASRSATIPGGAVFVVDPNFLSYTHTPVEISIVTRRNEANDNAGFKLVYESTDGFKNCGWYTVPDNKEWHTIKYKLTDAEFNAMWNFNFSLDSDGNQYNKYDIQSVTVTKLDQ